MYMLTEKNMLCASFEYNSMSISVTLRKPLEEAVNFIWTTEIISDYN